MTKTRKFLLKQFKTASALRVMGFQIGAHRCVWWGMPTLIAFFALLSCWQTQEWVFAQIPVAFRTDWWMKIPMFWYILLFALGGISTLYFYFIIIHFKIFPMTEDEWKELIDEGLIEME